MTTLKVEKLSRPFFAQLWIFHPVGKFFANHVPNLYPEAGQKFRMIFSKMFQISKITKKSQFPQTNVKVNIRTLLSHFRISWNPGSASSHPV